MVNKTSRARQLPLATTEGLVFTLSFFAASHPALSATDHRASTNILSDLIVVLLDLDSDPPAALPIHIDFWIRRSFVWPLNRRHPVVEALVPVNSCWKSKCYVVVISYLCACRWNASCYLSHTLSPSLPFSSCLVLLDRESPLQAVCHKGRASTRHQDCKEKEQQEEEELDPTNNISPSLPGPSFAVFFLVAWSSILPLKEIPYWRAVSNGRYCIALHCALSSGIENPVVVPSCPRITTTV